MPIQDEQEGRSRSARKRAAQAVEDLARRLVDLPESELRKLPADPEIVSELKSIRAIRSLPARDRQIRHLAGLLRRWEEVVPDLESFVSGLDRGHYEEQARFYRLEEWRDRLCEPDSFSQALEEVMEALPQADPAVLGRLARSVKSGDRHASREIFRYLRRASESTPG